MGDAFGAHVVLLVGVDQRDGPSGNQGFHRCVLSAEHFSVHVELDVMEAERVAKAVGGLCFGRFSWAAQEEETDLGQVPNGVTFGAGGV